MLIRDRRFKGFGMSLLDPNSNPFDPTSGNTGIIPGTGPLAVDLVPDPTPLYTPENGSTYVLAQPGDTSIDWKPIAAIGGGAVLLGLLAWAAS